MCEARREQDVTSPLQRWDQRVREGQAVAAGADAAERDAGGEAGDRRHRYSAGISACEKGDQWQRALALLSEMWEAKLEPNVMSCSAGISACEKGEQWQRALSLLNEMRESKLEPDPSSATTLASARAKRVSSGSVLWRCLAECGRRSWSSAASATAL
ncbi:unnamed protein product [Prorocentrum cordatum]|uniref:Uncharacterized protein n=1 Tax=Prorocentrum cordatum TaxID=2364126 RepID=A0ABN9WT41_9DINO|nr:unnamed protein product [Polarella glacialis]